MVSPQNTYLPKKEGSHDEIISHSVSKMQQRSFILSLRQKSRWVLEVSLPNLPTSICTRTPKSTGRASSEVSALSRVRKGILSASRSRALFNDRCGDKKCNHSFFEWKSTDAVVSDRYSAYNIPVKSVFHGARHIRVQSFKDDVSNNLIECFNKQFKACTKPSRAFLPLRALIT